MAAVVLAVVVLLSAGPLDSAQPPSTVRVSIASDGSESNGPSDGADLTPDGRYIVFASASDNLVGGDTNTASDVFLRDMATGLTSRVSVASDGTQGNGPSSAPSISGNGRFVAFESRASNLVAGDTNGKLDVFVHDRATGDTSRVSIGSDGSEGDDDSELPNLSGDGRLIAFDSRATNIVPGDGNDTWDVFVHDRSSGRTQRVSVPTGGGEGNDVSEVADLSRDGRYVGFHSLADNLVASDTNRRWDAFVHDRATGVTTRVSVSSEGIEGDNNSYLASLSGDGRSVVFFSLADNLVPGDRNGLSDVFVHDRATALTTRVSVSAGGATGDGHSGYASISADGRYVAFDSQATNLVVGDRNGFEDVFVHDRVTGDVERVSVGPGGRAPDGNSTSGRLSSDGRFVAYASAAGNLVDGDSNGHPDVFLHERAIEEAPQRERIYLPALNGARPPEHQRCRLHLPRLLQTHHP